MSLIKINHNNVAVKMPVNPIPTIVYSRSYYQVKSRTDGGDLIEPAQFPFEEDGLYIEKVSLKTLANISDPFFVGYEFEVYLNGAIVGYTTQDSDNEIVITDDPALRNPSFTVQLKGRYFGQNGYVYEFEKEIETHRYYYLCSEDTYCGEFVIVNEFFEGYFHEGQFYESMYVDGQSAVYENPMPAVEGSRYFDIQTGRMFAYNVSNEEYEEIS